MIPLESLLKIVVYQEANCHDFFIFNLADECEKFGLHGGERVEQIIQCLVLFSCSHAVDDLVGKVDISLNQIHVPDQLLILAGQVINVLCP